MQTIVNFSVHIVHFLFNSLVIQIQICKIWYKSLWIILFRTRGIDIYDVQTYMGA